MQNEPHGSCQLSVLSLLDVQVSLSTSAFALPASGLFQEDVHAFLDDAEGAQDVGGRFSFLKLKCSRINLVV